MALRRLGALASALALAGLCTSPLAASGGPPLSPNYIDAEGGSPGELARIYGGRMPVLMPAARDGMLLMAWRLLHELPVGEKAGAKLAVPCCTAPENAGGVWGWIRAREEVLGTYNGLYYIDTERRGPDYTSTPNCFAGAFDLAAATLADRARAHGAKSPSVRAWLAAQDGVFQACADPDAALPALPAQAPPWLRADRAYQEAAFALYQGRNVDAAARFAAIAGDSASPWRRYGAYLHARALHREALVRQTPESFGAARVALARLAVAPSESFGRGEADKLLNALEYREHPAELLMRLDKDLGAPAIGETAAVALHDYISLSRDNPARPDAADWILTVGAGPMDKATASGHARERWAATKDVAWLIAALAHTDAGTPEGKALATDAGRVPRAHPGWPTVQYHLIRLTLADADAVDVRQRLDAILAHSMLSRSERNLFAALRTQVARDRHDFLHFALRDAACPAAYPGCFSDQYWKKEPTLGWLPGGRPVGFGADALAIVDALPLHERIALAEDAALPKALRLDVALTSFARAVQLGRTASLDRLAGDLSSLLPQMRADWAAIRAAQPGPAKRFATYFAMAKLPGLRTDLEQHIRPQGTIAQFQGYWEDWLIADPAHRREAVSRPNLTPYQYAGWDEPVGDGLPDLLCLGKCGLGSAPFRLPPFAAALEKEAAAERGAFISERGLDDDPKATEGATPVWEELLSFARTHPRDPRSPESLYWLIHIARWGANRDHIGKRAFQLLHSRYRGSDWAKRSPYYYDWSPS